MKCKTCNKNRAETKFVVIRLMGKELVMCDECFKTSDMKLIRKYTDKGEE